jgi:hypothetical protein
VILVNEIKYCLKELQNYAVVINYFIRLFSRINV